ncbi:MAG TPA: hypothetical protein VME24_10020 [Alphaproteobacteria bacterium]|nr:hypothetical protein [Alphaproteobacteria bacterium]
MKKFPPRRFKFQEKKMSKPGDQTDPPDFSSKKSARIPNLKRKYI